MKLLLPSSDVGLVPPISAAYGRLGWEVVHGTERFFDDGVRPDLVHYLWPEELTGWKPPDDATIDRIRNQLARWRGTCRTLLSVNNLLPHGYENDPHSRRLYEAFYEHVDLVVHHSRASRDLVLQEFPAARRLPHVVVGMFSYHHLFPPGMTSAASRAELGVPARSRVVLSFGALRAAAEMRLMIDAYRRTRARRKFLLIGGMYRVRDPEAVGLWRRAYLRLLRKLGRCLWLSGFLPDSTVPHLFHAADAVMVPRLKDLSSGVVGVAMTAGTPMACPRHGAFPDYLEGSENALYDSGDPRSLGAALTGLLARDLAPIRSGNLRIAERWRWEHLLRAVLEALPVRSPAS